MGLSKAESYRCVFLTTIPVCHLSDVYRILGVEQNAELSEVRTAYKKMALKYHPDKNRSSDAAAQFKTIAEV